MGLEVAHSFGIILVCHQPKTYSNQMSPLLFLGVIVLLLTCCGDVKSIQYIRDLYRVALQMLALSGFVDVTPCIQQAKVSRYLLMRYGSNVYNINVILCTNRCGSAEQETLRNHPTQFHLLLLINQSDEMHLFRQQRRL